MIDKILNKIFKREFILYGVFGVMTSIENVLLFQVLNYVGLNYKIANFFTLIIVKLTAYVLNKNIVFRSHADSFINLLREFGRFVIARGATMIIEWVGLIIMVDFMRLDKLPCKIFLTILVIILNYFIGKKHVFKDVKHN